MSRGVLFRGKCLYNGKWVEGGYCYKHETTYCLETAAPNPIHHYIARDQMTDWNLPNQVVLYEVDPASVGQYTGKNDRDGQKIFEGDILKVSIDDFEPCEFREVVLWDAERCGYFVREQGSPDLFPLGDCDLKNSVVVGNIFDNPELME